ncbi:MAG: cytochrome b/b6 domain-containing protein [Acidobacteria bacterium]|nr:cytochrome b/b6 domain-containing protein [Acidobacteriota bacterium]
MCHGREGSRVAFVEKEMVGNSVHGRIRCTSCHRDVDSVPHAKDLASVSCSLCHSDQTKTYLNSMHGLAAKQDRTDAAACSDCHGNAHSVVGSDNPESPVNRGNILDTCARCHTDSERMASFRLSVKDPVNSYRQTVHGRVFLEGGMESAVCTDCHGTHDLLNSLDSKSRIFRMNIPDTCSRCHGEVTEIYKKSVHGRAAMEGIWESPVCTDCHGSHVVHSPGESATAASTGAVTRICASCHESELIIRKFDLPGDRLKTYSNSYHGLAARRGDLGVANCASCHGYHDILPSDDPDSSIHKSNLAKTCGNCHPGAGEALASGYVHVSPENRHWSVSFAEWLYWIFIVFSVGFMFFHNGLDWLHKAWTGVRTTLYPDVIRFTANERWQHGILAVVFVIMALTGFALRYSDALWARLLVPFDEGLRRSLHRWAALVFTLLSVYHISYLLLTERGRYILREMRPRWDDFKDMTAVIAYNTGIRKSPPIHKAFYRYSEKAEYWFLLWGGVVMVITGSVLAFHNFILRHFPLWVPELATTIHYYEATLACLAILFWHLYAVIFDPDVYPMNCAWWNGRIRCSEKGRLQGQKKYFKKIPYGRF